jgi:hypothetical protein
MTYENENSPSASLLHVKNVEGGVLRSSALALDVVVIDGVLVVVDGLALFVDSFMSSRSEAG